MTVTPSHGRCSVAIGSSAFKQANKLAATQTFLNSLVVPTLAPVQAAAAADGEDRIRSDGAAVRSSFPLSACARYAAYGK